MVALDDRRARRRPGCARHRIGVGDGALYRSLLDVARRARGRRTCRCSSACRGATWWASSVRVDALGPARTRERDLLVRLPELRGGPEVLDRATARSTGAVDGLRALHELLAERGVADRVIFDLGLVRELGYYTGAVFEVYDPAVGFTLGGGGRYDELLGRFGARAARLRHRARRAARAPRPGRRGGARDERRG